MQNINDARTYNKTVHGHLFERLDILICYLQLCPIYAFS